jgi:hypothetical protein
MSCMYREKYSSLVAYTKLTVPYGLIEIPSVWRDISLIDPSNSAMYRATNCFYNAKTFLSLMKYTPKRTLIFDKLAVDSYRTVTITRNGTCREETFSIAKPPVPEIGENLVHIVAGKHSFLLAVENKGFCYLIQANHGVHPMRVNKISYEKLIDRVKRFYENDSFYIEYYNLPSGFSQETAAKQYRKHKEKSVIDELTYNIVRSMY